MIGSEHKGLTYLQAIEIVLRTSDRPLKAKEIVREIRQRQLYKIHGDTPWNTVNARISEDIIKNGTDSQFIRTKSGSYTLRANYYGEEYKVPPRERSSLKSDVLVFPSDHLNQIGYFHGIRRDYEAYAEHLLNTKNSFFMSRKEAEETEVYKQVVTYVIIKHKDRLLRFVRGKITSIYKYLYGEYSIGFGGHVEKVDWDLFSRKDAGFENSVFRELSEEVGINLHEWDNSDYDLKMIGVLNDDSSPLGRRHFAFLLLLHINVDDFKQGYEFDKGEKSVNNLGLINIDSISNEFAGYEYWSKLTIQTFFSDRLATKCHIESTSEFRLNQQNSILLVVGYIGSGKTMACKLLSEEFGYTLVPCSRIMQNLIGCEPIEVIGRQKLQDEGLKLISKPDGHKKLAQSIIDYMNQAKSSNFVLDGLRYPETLLALKSLINKPITTIYIETTIDRLHQYYQLREGRICNMRDYMNVISHPVERSIERFVHISDIMIYNHGSWDSYTDMLRNFFYNELTKS